VQTEESASDVGDFSLVRDYASSVMGKCSSVYGLIEFTTAAK
jgi:hypothetical protein